ncbi:MAG: hypothetical protein ACR2MB_14200 [Acidimicrobiales bacterium]
MMWRSNILWLVVAEHGPDLTHLLESWPADAGPRRISLVMRPRDTPILRQALRALPVWNQVRSQSASGFQVVTLAR